MSDATSMGNIVMLPQGFNKRSAFLTTIPNCTPKDGADAVGRLLSSIAVYESFYRELYVPDPPCDAVHIYRWQHWYVGVWARPLCPGSGETYLSLVWRLSLGILPFSLPKLFPEACQQGGISGNLYGTALMTKTQVQKQTCSHVLMGMLFCARSSRMVFILLSCRPILNINEKMLFCCYIFTVCAEWPLMKLPAQQFFPHSYLTFWECRFHSFSCHPPRAQFFYCGHQAEITCDVLADGVLWTVSPGYDQLMGRWPTHLNTKYPKHANMPVYNGYCICLQWVLVGGCYAFSFSCSRGWGQPSIRFLLNPSTTRTLVPYY